MNITNFRVDLLTSKGLNFHVERITLSIIAKCLLIDAQSAMASQKPYWSSTPVNVGSDHKQYPIILTQLNSGLNQDVVKTRVCLQIYNPPEVIPVPGAPPWLHQACAPIINIAEELKTKAENTTLSVGYFIYPTSLRPNSVHCHIHLHLYQYNLVSFGKILARVAIQTTYVFKTIHG
ncbi:MAG TPA: hypothetical protein VH500_00995 [Nitrososphaeraceae archaeon]